MDPDPGSGACLTPGSRMGKKSGSNPDHISKSLEIIFWGLKYLNSLMQIAGSGMEKIRIGIWDKHPGSATLHWSIGKKNRLLLPYPTTGDKLASLCECIFDVNVQNQIQNKCRIGLNKKICINTCKFFF